MYTEYEEILAVNGSQEVEDEIVVRFKVTEERAQRMTGRMYRKAGTDPETTFDFLALFMADENGQFIGHDRAIEILDEMSLDEIGEAMNALMEQVQGIAAKKKNGKRSTKVRILASQ